MKKGRKYEIKLTDKQIEFYKSFRNKNIKEILVGGGARGGKTRGVIEIIIESCLKYPGIKWIIGRNEWDDLRKTTLQSIVKTLNEKGFKDKKMDKKTGEYDLNYQTKELNFYNGSGIFFVPLKKQPSDPEFNWLGGYEITFFFIDEAQEVDKKVFSILKSRCTEKIKEYNLIGKGILSCNPMKGWLYDRYIKPNKEGTLGENKVFIQSLYKDNPFINHKEYEASLEDADQITKERLLKGNWDYDDTPGKLYDYDLLLNMFNYNILYNDDLEEYYMSIDGAGEGKDRGVIFVWKGFKIIDGYIFEGKIDIINDMGKKAQEFIAKYNIKTENIVNDHNGIGAGLSDVIGGNIYKFHSQSSEEKEKDDPKRFGSLRDQIFFELKKQLEKIKVDKKFDKYKEQIIKELDVMVQIDIDKSNYFKVIPKDQIKKIIGNSPDFADTIGMRMIFNLIKKKKAFIYFGK